MGELLPRLVLSQLRPNSMLSMMEAKWVVASSFMLQPPPRKKDSATRVVKG